MLATTIAIVLATSAQAPAEAGTAPTHAAKAAAVRVAGTDPKRRSPPPPTPPADIGKTISEGAPATWSTVPEQDRYVMIMAAMDAAAVSRELGETAEPICGKELDNRTLDERLGAIGYNAAGTRLTLALRMAARPKTLAEGESWPKTCDDKARGYDTVLLSRMSNDHLSLYISTFVDNLSLPASCLGSDLASEERKQMAARIAGAILAPDQALTAPVERLALVVADTCRAAAPTIPDEPPVAPAK